MRKLILIAGVPMDLIAGAARANTILDPTGDFLVTYAGSHDPDLDVTSFTVDYDASTTNFDLMATLAGPIDPSKVGFYVIGVNTGTGTIAPFASIGEPNVIFNQAIVVQKTGAAAVSGHALTASITGDEFSVLVPLADLPSTGFAPEHYGFNLWPRDGSGSNSQISDFAPQNATLSAVPEPSVWATMVVGLLMVGGLMRARRRAPTPVGL